MPQTLPSINYVDPMLYLQISTNVVNRDHLPRKLQKALPPFSSFPLQDLV